MGVDIDDALAGAHGLAAQTQDPEPPRRPSATVSFCLSEAASSCRSSCLTASGSTAPTHCEAEPGTVRYGEFEEMKKVKVEGRRTGPQSRRDANALRMRAGSRKREGETRDYYSLPSRARQVGFLYITRD